MSLQQSAAAAPQRQREIARDVFIGREPETLDAIHSSGVAAAIWQRKPDPGFQDWIDAVPPENLPRLRVTAPIDQVGKLVRAACGTAGLKASPERTMLIEDIAAQAFILGQIARTRTVALRLQVIETVSCPKFHIDHVPVRLLCTYRGRGTSYAADTNINTPGRHGTVPTGAVGLFRGELWPGSERCGLFHRSPEVGAGERARLLLVIDPAR